MRAWNWDVLECRLQWSLYVLDFTSYIALMVQQIKQHCGISCPLPISIQCWYAPYTTRENAWNKVLVDRVLKNGNVKRPWTKAKEHCKIVDCGIYICDVPLFKDDEGHSEDIKVSRRSGRTEQTCIQSIKRKESLLSFLLDRATLLSSLSSWFPGLRAAHWLNIICILSQRS
jgi:hypothetical protein